MMKQVKTVIGELIDVGILLVALAVVLSLLVGDPAGNILFFGSVVANIVGLIRSLGDAGLAGLIALGVILWIFSNR